MSIASRFTTTRHAQRGAASLVVALVLLFGMTIVAFFANRSFIFEQRTSANQYRATKAFELAEAGVEWAIGKLNERLPLEAAPSCEPAVAGTASFRERFVAPSAGAMNVNAAGFPGCRIDDAGTTFTATCDCPLAGQVSLGPVTDQGRFGVRFVPVGGDPAAIEIIARGCTNGGSCDPNDGDVPSSDATAQVRVVVKVVPSVPNGPAAALTTGGDLIVTTGNIHVINTHAPSNGITIHAGESVATGTGSGANVTTLAGTAPRASVLDNDTALAYLRHAGADEFFGAFFGQTLANYSTRDPDVKNVSGCGSASACAAEIVAYVNSGVQNPRLYVDTDVAFTNSTPGLGASLGTASNPVTIVSAGNLELGTNLPASNLTAYGLFYAATGSSTDSGGGTTNVFGAFISRGNFNKGAGNLTLVYDPALWGSTSPPTGRLVRVPGSWRDKSTDY